jgi:hypothetical protein
VSFLWFIGVSEERPSVELKLAIPNRVNVSTIHLEIHVLVTASGLSG